VKSHGRINQWWKEREAEGFRAVKRKEEEEEKGGRGGGRGWRRWRMSVL
jgi:hypothetical protein